MRTRGSRSKPAPDARVTDAALDAMTAGELRSLIRDMLPWLDEALQARFANELVDRAARNDSGWVPNGPTVAMVHEVEAFAEAAQRLGHAEPSDVDTYLREGSHAFLGRNYALALRIFRALLLPIGCCDIDLGQHEMIDEVLGVDVAACATQYVVATYMTSTSQDRATSVLSAIDEMRGMGHFWEPLRELERVAIEPLPEFDDFLIEWKTHVQHRAQGDRKSDWESDADRWLREVVQRTLGPEGLAEVARASRRAEDLRAWCRAWVEVGDWKAALRAYEEAAGLVSAKDYSRGGFLDGAALAAQELGRKDLPTLLERAWREAPSMARLRRWLGSSASRKVLLGRVTQAVAHCPKRVRRQRALLHFLNGDLAAAAELLASADGLGWSDEDHPGHLLFPLFAGLLGGVELSGESAWDYDDLGLLADRDEPRLATPEVADLVGLAAIGVPSDAATRSKIIGAMRAAAEKRIAGVTEKKRRRHYGHAAALAIACVQVDDPVPGRKWLEGIRDEYRRYPALRRELVVGEGRT